MITKDILMRLYWHKGMTIKEIAEREGCSGTKIKNAMKRLGIPKRNRSEYMRLLFIQKKKDYHGSNHPHWKGGKEIYHRRISWKVKPKYQCELCGSKKFLDVHHKDKDITNNSIENIQILCRSCHNTIEPRFKGKKLEIV